MKYRHDISRKIAYLIFSKIGKDFAKFVVCCSCDRRFKGLRSNQSRVSLLILCILIITIPISTALTNRQALMHISLALIIKVYPGGFSEYRFPYFQKLQKIALGCWISFGIMTNSDYPHENEVLISKVKGSI